MNKLFLFIIVSISVFSINGFAQSPGTNEDEPVCYKAALGEMQPPSDDSKNNASSNGGQDSSGGSAEGKNNSIEVVPQFTDNQKLSCGYIDQKNNIIVTGCFGDSKIVRIWGLTSGKLIRTISLLNGQDDYDFLRAKQLIRVYPYGDGKKTVVVTYQPKIGDLTDTIDVDVIDLNTGKSCTDNWGSDMPFDTNLAENQKNNVWKNTDYSEDNKMIVAVGGDQIIYDYLRHRPDEVTKKFKGIITFYAGLKINPDDIGLDDKFSFVAVDIVSSSVIRALVKTNLNEHIVVDIDIINRQFLQKYEISHFLKMATSWKSNIKSYLQQDNVLYTNKKLSLIRNDNIAGVISNNNKKVFHTLQGNISRADSINCNSNGSVQAVWNRCASSIQIIDNIKAASHVVYLNEPSSRIHASFSKNNQDIYVTALNSSGDQILLYLVNSNFEIKKIVSCQLTIPGNVSLFESGLSSSGRYLLCSLIVNKKPESVVFNVVSGATIFMCHGPASFFNKTDIAVNASNHEISLFDCSTLNNDRTCNLDSCSFYNSVNEISPTMTEEYGLAGKWKKFPLSFLLKAHVNTDSSNGQNWEPFKISVSANDTSWSVSYKYPNHKPDDTKNLSFLVMNYKNKYFFNMLYQDRLNVFLSDDGQIYTCSHDKIETDLHQNWNSVYKNQSDNPYQYGNISFIASEKQLYHISAHGIITKIDYNGLKPIDQYTLYPSSNGSVLFLLNNQQYMSLGNAYSLLAFADGLKSIPLEQFDLRLNRPDIVLDRLRAPKEAIEAAKSLRDKRLKRMGVTEEMLKPDFHLPEIQIMGDVPASTPKDQLDLQIKATDNKYPLDRLRVYVNNVPVNGRDGEFLRDQKTQILEKPIPIKLATGRNKIQVSVLNSAGAESLYANAEVNCTADRPKPKLYAVALGVSQYDRPEWCLKYAAKDATDLISKIKEKAGSSYSEVKPLLLTDKEVTKESVTKIKEFLSGATIDDTVLIFMAGHGLLDDKYDYYFGTSDIDPVKPSERGMPYDAIDTILAEVPSLKKALLMDTCHAGELDDDEKRELAAQDGTVAPAASPDTSTNSSALAGKVAMRSIGTRGMSVKAIQGAKGKSDWYEKLQDTFVDLRRGSGATVISSSQGAEYAFESSEQSNGLFTYALMEALNGKATSSKDGQITISTVGDYVKKRVQDLTIGKQNPNLRGVNLEEDFAFDSMGSRKIPNSGGQNNNDLPTSGDLTAMSGNIISHNDLSPVRPTSSSLITSSSEGRVLEFDEALRRADEGDAYAQAVVSIYYGMGYKIEKDVSRSASYALKSAAQGNPLGIYRVGVMRSNGDGMQKNAEQGRSLKRKAFNGLNSMTADPYALNILGVLAYTGDGVSQDINEALRLYKLSADLGYAPAQYNYASLILDGGAPGDPEEAQAYKQKATGQNFQPSL